MQQRRSAEQQSADLRDFLSPHLDSFNWAVTDGLNHLPNWILPEEYVTSDGQFLRIRVGSVSLSKPMNIRDEPVYPWECRLRGETYGGTLKIGLLVQYNQQQEKKISVAVPNIPVMVNSCLCHLSSMSPEEKVQHREEETECGGFFVASGYDKLLRLIVLPRQNFIFAINRQSFAGRGANFSTLATSLRSMAPDGSSLTTNIHYLTTGNMMVTFSIQKRMFFVQLVLVLKALVECDDKSIYLSVTQGKPDSFMGDRLIAMLRYYQEWHLWTKDAVRDYLGAHFRNVIGAPSHWTNDQCCQMLLDRYLFPHLTGKDMKAKFDLLILMIRTLLLLVKGEIRNNNMDSCAFHELLTPGTLWLSLLSESIHNLLQETKRNIVSEQDFPLDDIGKIETLLNKNSIRIEKRMAYLFSTGSIRGNSTLGLQQLDGLTIMAERINYARYLSHYRSVHRGAFFASMKTTEVRRLLPESWGFLCPVHTPDGGLCGLLLHLARMCKVVCGDPEGDEEFIKALTRCGMVCFPFADGIPCIVNGQIRGYMSEVLVEKAFRFIRNERVHHRLPVQSEIVLLPSDGFSRSLYVFTNQQRMMRPVHNCRVHKQEFIGPLEQMFMSIAALPTDKTKPYREVHETSILSLVASLTPFSDYNQSPRNMYQCQMAKQTMGYPHHNEQVKTESKTYHVHYPQYPIVCCSTQDSHALLDFPLGCNAVVAVLSYTGYDMEDAFIMNKASLERGFGHGCIFRTRRYCASEFVKDGVFSNPDNDKELDQNGLPFVGAHVHKGDKLLRIVNEKQKVSKYCRYKESEEGIIDQVITCGNEEGLLDSVLIKVRIIRTPTIGDKFSSRHGQKGVLSFPWPEENMPFTESGIRPDIIINPHAFPSRMTIGMLIESMCGKVKASEGCEPFDATPFQYDEDNRITDVIGQELVKHGYNYYGNEVMYSGITGEQFKADIFLGVVYYQRLRHMVGDKYQVRATGRMNNITRQPLKGRKKGGGIRLGEMERDGLLGQGVSFLLRDRFMWCSDGCTAELCNQCSSFLFTEKRTNESGYTETYCRFCKHAGRTTTIQIPYVFRYLAAELAAMNIRMICNVKDREE